MFDIGIFGSSWGMGEWDSKPQNKLSDDQFQIDQHSQPNYVVHKGIEKYFVDAGLNVLNASKSALPNQSVLDLLNSFHKKCKLLIFIMTHPYYDFEIRPTLYSKNLSLKKNLDNLIAKQISMLENYKTKTIIVNGLHTLDEQKKFIQHIHWPQLCSPDLNWPKYYIYTLKNILEQKLLPLTKEDIIWSGNDQKKQEEFWLSMNIDKQMFKRDHPNREAHKILANKILEII